MSASFFSDRPFKLLLKPPKKEIQPLVIAIGNKDEMESHWNVANHIVETGTAGTGAGINFHDKSLSLVEKWAFLRSKIEGLAIDQEHQQKQAQTAASSPRSHSSSTGATGAPQGVKNEASKAKAKDLKPLPEEFGLPGEFCISEYRCSLFGKALPRTGILYAPRLSNFLTSSCF